MYENKLVNYSIIFIALVLMATVLKTFQSVLRPLAMSVLLIFVVTPLVRYSKQKRIPVWLTFLCLFVIIMIPLVLANSYITLENTDLGNAIPIFKERINNNSGSLIAFGAKIGLGLEDFTPEKLGQFAAKGTTICLQAARTIFSEFLLAMVLLMFVVQAYSGIFVMVGKRYGKSEVLKLQETIKKIERDIITYFGTKTLISLATAVVTLIILYLFKAKFIYFSALIIFILNYIPIIGSLIAVVILTILYILATELSMNVLWLFISLTGIQVLFGSIIEPKISGDKLDMSPILIILCLYLWGWIWGIIGMLLAVPLTVFVMIIIKHLRPTKRQVT